MGMRVTSKSLVDTSRTSPQQQYYPQSAEADIRSQKVGSGFAPAEAGTAAGRQVSSTV